jgi:hypothetical protein
LCSYQSLLPYSGPKFSINGQRSIFLNSDPSLPFESLLPSFVDVVAPFNLQLYSEIFLVNPKICPVGIARPELGSQPSPALLSIHSFIGPSLNSIHSFNGYFSSKQIFIFIFKAPFTSTQQLQYSSFKQIIISVFKAPSTSTQK